MNMRSIVVLLAFMCCVAMVSAQSFQPHAVYSPRGVWILASEWSVGASLDTTEIVVERIAHGSATRVGTIKRVSSLRELASMCGTQLLQELKEMRRLSDDDATWRVVQQHTSLGWYSGVLYNPHIRVALGTALIDSGALALERGTAVQYKLRYVASKGSSEKTLSVTMGAMPMLPSPALQTMEITDSLVQFSCVQTPAAGNVSFLAAVYKSQDEEPFTQLDYFVKPARVKDSLVYRIIDKVLPEKLYRYVVVPMDEVGTYGMPSDTITALSLQFTRMPAIYNATVRDEQRGVIVTWNAVPPKPYWSGIEISRRDKLGAAFVALDTVPATDTLFNDVRVASNGQYTYALRLLTFRSTNEAPSTYVQHVRSATQHIPLAPLNVQAHQEGKGIRVTWQSNNEESCRGFAVYRAVGADTNYALVSRIIKETTFLDTDSTLFGKTTYSYYVRAVSYADEQSKPSNTATARPNKTVYPQEPAAVFVNSDVNRIELFWKTNNDDKTVHQWNVYKRTNLSQKTILKAPAMQYAKQAGWQHIATVREAMLIDTAVQQGVTYQYAVSSLDEESIESAMLPSKEFILPYPEIRSPSALQGRSTPTGVVLSWSKQLQEGIKSIAIYRRTIDGDFTRIATIESTQHEYTDTTAQNGTTYIYTLRSVSMQSKESARTKEIAIEKEP